MDGIDESTADVRVLFLMPFDYKKMQTGKQFLVIHSVGTVRAFFLIFLYLYVKIGRAHV